MILNKIVELYISIIEKIYRFTKRIPERVRSIVISVCIAYLIYYKYEQCSDHGYFFVLPTNHWLIIITICFFFLIIFSINNEVKKPLVNKIVAYLYIIEIIGVIIRYIFFGNDSNLSSVYYNDDYYLLSILIQIFVFPFLYIIWNNRKDYEYLFDRFAISMAIFGLLYFLYFFVLANKGALYSDVNGIFRSIMSQATTLGDLGANVAIASLYLIYRYFNKKYLLIISSLTFSIGCLFSYWATCRAALLAIIICSLLFIIYTSYKENDKKSYYKKTMFVSLMFFVFFSILLCVKQYLIDIQRANNPTEYVKQGVSLFSKYGNDLVNHSFINSLITIFVIVIIMIVITQFILWIEKNSKKYFKKKNVYIFIGCLVIMFFLVVLIIKIINPDKTNIIFYLFVRLFDKLKEMSSGRFGIWNNYIKHFNMVGNHYDVVFPEFAGKTIWMPHNNIVEFTFKYGIPCGIIYIAKLATICIYTLKLAFKNKKKEYYQLFVLLVVTLFNIYALVEVSTTPFHRFSVMLFYIAIAPIFNKEEFIK